MEQELLQKYDKLKEHLALFGSAAIAFSGGVDSTFLLYAAKEALGDKALAITAVSSLVPKREINEAKEYCDKLGIRHVFVNIDELSIEGFADNPKNRCYICKKEIFKHIGMAAKEAGISVVAEGSNLDDQGDYRPGLQAIAELGIKSPLRDAGFSKQEIRDLSEYLKLPTWNKPSFACLASRFPYGEVISKEKLERVDKAEQLLLDMGFKQFRVRIHGDVARIELLPEDFSQMMEEATRCKVYDRFKEYGFAYAALDLMGYRTGSLNENL